MGDITKNFSYSEFDCKSKRAMPEDIKLQITALAKNLQVLRDHLSTTIHITSGYRDPLYNKQIGGAKSSQHMLGRAADIQIRGFTPKDVHSAIEALIAQGKMQQGGLGLYSGWGITIFEAPAPAGEDSARDWIYKLKWQAGRDGQFPPHPIHPV